MFTPNWQIPEKKINQLRERLSFGNSNNDKKMNNSFLSGGNCSYSDYGEVFCFSFGSSTATTGSETKTFFSCGRGLSTATIESNTFGPLKTGWRNPVSACCEKTETPKLSRSERTE